MQKRTVHPFLPIFSADSRVLILGSFPSVRSRAEGFYYSHPRNRFWPLMSILFHRDAESVEDRTTLLLDNHIALWDAAHTCEREGSLDADMRRAEAYAVWICVMTLVTSLNGLVYWLA